MSLSLYLPIAPDNPDNYRDRDGITCFFLLVSLYLYLLTCVFLLATCVFVLVSFTCIFLLATCVFVLGSYIFIYCIKFKIKAMAVRVEVMALITNT
jgi:hypothetical protein